MKQNIMVSEAKNCKCQKRNQKFVRGGADDSQYLRRDAAAIFFLTSFNKGGRGRPPGSATECRENLTNRKTRTQDALSRLKVTYKCAAG